MLSNKNTLRSSTSTLVTGTLTNPSIHFTQEDIKVIFVKSKKHKKTQSLFEKKNTIEEDDNSNYRPILRSNRKYTSKSAYSGNNKNEKSVKFKDELDSVSDSDKRKSRLAEIFIVPSYKNFYNKVYIDEEEKKTEKVRVRCACMIF